MLRPLLPALLAVALPAAAKPPAITGAAIHWSGAAGRTVHGYMALPAKARGRQPAVLVLADVAAGGQPAAQAMVDALARAGFLACTPRGDESAADLGASLTWLEGNRYGTGRVAFVALGGVAALRAGEVAAVAARPPVAVVSFAEAGTPGGPLPSLALPALAPGAPLPTAAVTFLREHLR